MVCAECAVLVIFLTCLFLFLVNRETISESGKEDIPPQEETAAAKEVSGDTVSVSDNDSGEIPAEEKSYPEPEYQFHQEEVVIPIAGLSREYTIAWVSDLHLITDLTPGGISEGSIVTVRKRYNSFSVTQDGVHAQELWPEIIKFINAGAFDGVIFGGDMLDYCSVSNMETLAEGYRNIRPDTQILYIRADHDYGAWYVGSGFTQLNIYELHEELDGDRLEEKYLDFGEFRIIGINDSTRNIAREYLPVILDLYNTDKPIIAVTHVPYPSYVDSSLKELSLKVRGTVYYWSGENYQPNEETKKYFERIYSEDTKVKQVLAGHLHASWDGMITEQVPEHIFGPAFAGNVGVIHIVPETDAGENADVSGNSEK